MKASDVCETGEGTKVWFHYRPTLSAIVEASSHQDINTAVRKGVRSHHKTTTPERHATHVNNPTELARLLLLHRFLVGVVGFLPGMIVRLATGLVRFLTGFVQFMPGLMRLVAGFMRYCPGLVCCSPSPVSDIALHRRDTIGCRPANAPDGLPGLFRGSAYREQD